MSGAATAAAVAAPAATTLVIPLVLPAEPWLPREGAHWWGLKSVGTVDVPQEAFMAVLRLDKE